MKKGKKKSVSGYANCKDAAIKQRDHTCYLSFEFTPLVVVRCIILTISVGFNYWNT